MADNLLSLYAQTARGLGNPQNALSRYATDDEAMANYLAMQPQQPLRNGLDRDALLPWAYEVKDGQRSPTGQLAVPQMGVDIWNAIKSVGNAPLTAPYNPAERDNMIEQAGAVVGPMAGVGIARGAMAPRGSSEVGIFGGRLAKTADRNKLAVAEWGDKTGVPREKIWNDTGWFKGPDGKWRFEIPDNKARLDLVKLIEDENAYAGSVFHHAPLYEAYPSAKNTLVAHEPNARNAGFYPSLDEITLPRPVTKTMLHEMQHKVASEEGFASGADSSRGLDAYRNSAGEVEARTVEKRQNMTPEERAARPPWLDYDVPEANQIVTTSNGGLQYSLPDQPGIRAFHGSPYDFDRFSLDKIGTGEGAQAYGHGLYFAESEGVARSYRDKLTTDLQIGGKPFDERDPSHVAAYAVFVNRGDRAAAAKGISDQIGWMRQSETATVRYQEAARLARDLGWTPPEVQGGRLYEVSIKADPEDFLDWDKPLSQQSEKVSGALKDFGQTPQDFDAAIAALRVRRENPISRGGDTSAYIKAIDERIADLEAKKAVYDVPAGQFFERLNYGRNEIKDQVSASKRLREAGIPGIKYLDQGSRSAGEGSRNYVVFDDALVQILRKYGLLPPAVVGAVAASGQDQAQARQ